MVLYAKTFFSSSSLTFQEYLKMLFQSFLIVSYSDCCCFNFYSVYSRTIFKFLISSLRDQFYFWQAQIRDYAVLRASSRILHWTLRLAIYQSLVAKSSDSSIESGDVIFRLIIVINYVLLSVNLEHWYLQNQWFKNSIKILDLYPIRYSWDLNPQYLTFQYQSINTFKNLQQLQTMEEYDIFEPYVFDTLTAPSTNSSFGFSQLIGIVLIMLVAGLSSLAGLGGGGPNIVIMIIFFDMLPKTATLVAFANVFGAAFGNVVNQMQRALNNQPVVNYNVAFIVIPIMFMGALVGVFLNRFLPSLILMIIIMGVATNSLPKIYKRFVDGHKKQTQQLMLITQNQGRASELIQQTNVNPFESQLNIRIFKRIVLMIICYSCISLMRGSQKFPSILGITSCSFLYWVLQLALFLQALLFFKSNKHLLQVWYAPAVTLGQMLFEKQQDIISQNIRQIFIGSFCAGIFNGFGLGGGIFLIPMLRRLKLSAIHASSTTAFIVCISSFINVLQVMFMGVLSLETFMFFFSVCSLGSFAISLILSKYLRRINRLSYVQLLLLVLLVTANVYFPYSLWLKYERSGRDINVVLGFGSLC